MGPTRTRTVKNKHAAPKSLGGAKGGAKRSSTSGVSKSKKPTGPAQAKQLKEGNRPKQAKKPKKEVYTAEDLGIPELNMVTPAGAVKPRGKKKGKVFVDDTESMNTILAMVQADQSGLIESKMIKTRQLEEIREARKAEAAKKEADRKATLEDTKQSLRRKRKRKNTGAADELGQDAAGSAAASAKPRKKVSFA